MASPQVCIASTAIRSSCASPPASSQAQYQCIVQCEEYPSASTALQCLSQLQGTNDSQPHFLLTRSGGKALHTLPG